MAKTAKKTAPDTTTEPGHDITPIPLYLLSLSPLNVRRVATDVTDLETNIAANGLLQSLVVVPSVKGALITHDGNLPMYDVVCGGRRLQALGNLYQVDRLPRDFPVPCRIVTAEQAVALSLAENQQREPMHPVDEAIAFAGLLAAKMKKKTIATLYGVTPRYIDQRVKLAGVAPELLEAARAGRLTLEVLQAFTLTDDHEKQRQVYTVVSNSGIDVLTDDDAWEVANKLDDDYLPSDDHRVEFVGLDAYREAGGTFVEDLFSDEDVPTLLKNVALVEKLAEKKLRKEAKKYEREGWKAVDITLEPPSRCGYQSAYPVDDDAGFSAEERAVLRAVVGIDFTGNANCWKGWFKPEDKKAFCELHARLSEQEGDTTTNTTTASGGDGGEPKKPPSPGRRSDDIRFADLCADVLRIRSDMIEQVDALQRWRETLVVIGEDVPADIITGLRKCIDELYAAVG